jgi:phage head maturation protease
MEFSRALELKRDSVLPDGSFSGLASTFGNTDAGGDTVAKGAFRESLADAKRNGAFVPMLLNHGGLLGSAEDMIPIGRWLDMTETDTGLQVQGRLFALDTPKNSPRSRSHESRHADRALHRLHRKRRRVWERTGRRAKPDVDIG